METQKFIVLNNQSSIEWLGKKVTGSHNGTIDIKEGAIVLKDGQLAEGKFVIDTTSIKILDVADPALNTQFAGHLASDDFFSSEKHPEAILEVTSVSGNHVEADLTIKGITQPVDFDIDLNVDNDALTAKGFVIVDRTKYNMKFRSGNFFKDLGDTLIYNDFELSVNITAKAI